MDSGIERTETPGTVRFMTWRFSAFMVVGGALLAACSSSSKDSTGPTPGPVAFVNATSVTLQSGSAGQSAGTRPSVKVVDNGGIPVPGVAVTFRVSAGGGSLSGASQTTDAGGVATVGSWTLGPTPDTNIVIATAVGASDSVCFVATVGGPGSNFTIQLQYLSCVTSAQENAFSAAAARWAEVITGDLGAVNIGSFTTASFCGSAPVAGTVNDLLIIVDLKPYDGPGKVLGAASLCYVRDTGDPSPGMPVIGYMFFDTADLSALQATGRLNDVILHEMGHVLGIGTMWEGGGNQFVVATSPSTGSKLGFNGPNAVSAYKNLNGAAGATTVPVEDTNVVGTSRSHWKEDVLKNELMTGYLSGAVRPLSATTVGSLADLGYTVDLGAADPFNVLTAGLRVQGPSEPGLDLGNDVIAIPRQYIDPVTGVPRRPRVH